MGADRCDRPHARIGADAASMRVRLTGSAVGRQRLHEILALVDAGTLSEQRQIFLGAAQGRRERVERYAATEMKNAV